MYRRLIPDALSMNSGDDSWRGGWAPAALARRTNSLNAMHSSSFVRICSGCQTPAPVIAVPVVIRAPDIHLESHEPRAPEGVGASDLAVIASQRAIAAAGLDASDIDYIIFATMTPDLPFPGPGGLR